MTLAADVLQQTLDQHIGVRIPGGQPNVFNRFPAPVPPETWARSRLLTCLLAIGVGGRVVAGTSSLEAAAAAAGGG